MPWTGFARGESTGRLSEGELCGMIENLEVQPGIPSAKVVINSRTGTVVINQQVKISAAAVSHGTVNVSVSTLNEVSQPGPSLRVGVLRRAMSRIPLLRCPRARVARV